MGARLASPVSRPSTTENWPVTPIASRAGSALRHVVAGDPDPAAVAADQRGQHVHGSGFGGAVGPEQREGRSFGEGPVDAAQDKLVAGHGPFSGRS